MNGLAYVIVMGTFLKLSHIALMFRCLKKNFNIDIDNTRLIRLFFIETNRAMITVTVLF